MQRVEIKGTTIVMGRSVSVYLASAFAISTAVAASTGIAAGASAPGPFRISLEPSYFSGNFGSAHVFRVYDLPLSVIYRKSRLRVRVELPYVAIAGAGRISGGTVLHGGHHTHFRQGLGDFWISAQYRLCAASGIRPSISPLLKIKVPLASRQKGLGTGKADAEFGGRFEWRIGQRIFPYLTLGYRINGRAHRLKLRNAIVYQVGASVVFAHKQYVTAVLIGHSGFQRRIGPTNSVVLAYNITLTPVWSFETYVDRGLSPNSPAIGVGLGVTAGF